MGPGAPAGAVRLYELRPSSLGVAGWAWVLLAGWMDMRDETGCGVVHALHGSKLGPAAVVSTFRPHVVVTMHCPLPRAAAKFDFNDFLKQYKMVTGMGNLSTLVKMLPGGRLPALHSQNE